MKIIYMMYLMFLHDVNSYKSLGYMQDFIPPTFERYKGV